MKYKGFLIDLDGTAYLGEKEIPTASNFVNELVKKNIDFLFVSNNSSKAPKAIANKLQAHNYNVTEKHIFTSAQATRMYVEQEHKNQTYYLIGDDGLQKELEKTSLILSDDETDKIDLVIVGYDDKLDYEKLTKANIMLRNGAQLISTNPDICLPTQRGLLPGNGAIVSFLETSSQQKAITIGKPSSIIMDYAVELLDISKSDIAMIGDNYDTDIMSGINADIDTIYVQTGLSTIAEINKKEIKPTIILKDLSEYQF